ncbi:unnamed protein product [Strongylus vulgaris]|uniref:Lipocalin/cytosolic fatty-acid binding domain-containing protein n=1 Tax=Strongylus vulgaris TaxID=40348 RepID=A0A3P7JR51_STRVU|nr:unnamed protein product [Strongylus vulgaris]
MTTRLDVICIMLAICQLGQSASASEDEVKEFLGKVFQASNKENINKVFTIQTKNDELILESMDAKAAKNADGTPANTVQIVVGSTGEQREITDIS